MVFERARANGLAAVGEWKAWSDGPARGGRRSPTL